jgi:restriction system protein
MAIWLVRAGKHGEREEEALTEGLAVVGWEELGDLSKGVTRDEFAEMVRETYPSDGQNTVTNWIGQLWAFRERIQVGDLIVLPLKRRSAIAIGRCTGPYQYRADLEDHHVRPVQWLRTDLPRSAFDQDILYSLGAFLTVCQITRNNAEERIRAILENRAPITPIASPEIPPTEANAPIDLAQFANDQLLAFIEQKFKGHGMAQLVEGVLQASGYITALSPPGPDGGVDIIAGRGSLGFEGPKLCVQVKSSSSPVGVEVLRSLHGTMKTFGADQGLLVAWGGFKDTVRSEAKSQFFTIRLWDSGQLIRSVLDSYDKLSPEIQAMLPLKRIWILVDE